MRYTNWDVLLFQVGPKAPLQEFRTGCYVVQDAEFFLRDHLRSTLASIAASEHTLPRQLPTVTCFIPSLQNGSPFKVSLYSWEAPVLSTEATKYATQCGGTVCFEARILIDETCFTGLLFNEKATFPQILDTSYLLNKDGKRDSLRFPFFRTEMLSQNYWDAGENIGRIKVVISEGVLPALAALPFKRFKNLVSFSFQHAPLAILERAGIAWPNQGMWYQPSQPFYDLSSPTEVNAKEDSRLQSNSSRRATRLSRHRGNDPTLTGGFLDAQILMGPPPPSRSGIDGADLPWPSLLQMPDPFDGNGHRYIPNHHVTRLSDEDQSTLDFSHMISPTPIDDPLLPWSRSRTASQAENEQFMNDSGGVREQLTDVATVANVGGNHRANEIANNLLALIGSVPEERPSISRDHEHVTAITTNNDKLHDAPISEYSTPKFHMNNTQPKPSKTPTGQARGKKEGKTGSLFVHPLERKKLSRRLEDEENQAPESSDIAMSSKGKRKRTNTVAGPMASIQGTKINSSPIKKLARVIVPKNEEASPDKSSDESPLLREPLVSLENIQ